MARYIWNAIYLTFGVKQPRNSSHLFGNWLRGFEPKLKRQTWVIFKATQLSRLWSLLLKEDEGIEVIAKCKLLEKRTNGPEGTDTLDDIVAELFNDDFMEGYDAVVDGDQDFVP
uniref:Uncharacterized protein n=1 Tax=Oryza sativa subsp. japonica TaxID=39947 RepID=Q67W49_ORYSJ|nr:hypothetical protein [Oryza sativa Japonica Group]BAD37620.1 hypothetical protein [Oryza sativa Japonica Group]